MESVCICGEVHLPYQVRWYWPDEGYRKPEMETYFDQKAIYSRFERVAKETICTNHMMKDFLAAGGICSFNISGTFLDQCKWHTDVIKSFKNLADTGQVEFMASPYYHSVCSLYSDLSQFNEQVTRHRDTITDLFGTVPKTFVNSELILSKSITNSLKKMGFECQISEGSHNVVKEYCPVHVYNSHFPTLLRHIDLSEDLELHFSDRTWVGYPLIADKFASWINDMEGDIVTLYFNYDSIARHHNNGSYIGKFMRELPESLADHGIDMVTPTQAVRRFRTVKLPTLDTESTARYGMHSLFGSHAQHLYLQELMIIGEELQQIKSTSEYDTLNEIYGCLQQSSILLDMNPENFQLAYERAVNNYSILSDLRRAILEVRA
ncbi:MAG: glycoside hydrolase family 57 protein [Euryarchaeota archaeon]|nr:glycoside hydrolase family 57 protein [Euryarchaeota archaeon]